MPMPSIHELTTPLLEELADGVERSTRALRERLALRFGLSSTELARRAPDGGRVFDERVNSARAWLRRQGLVDYPLRGHARITAVGLERLGGGRGLSQPERQERTGRVPLISAGPLESELRVLTGEAARRSEVWTAICLLSGWGPEYISSCSEVAERTGLPVDELRPLTRPLASSASADAPTLDAVLAFAGAHLWLDLDEYPFHLMQIGFVRSNFSIEGVCEAARRFGRTAQWRSLVRKLATARGRGTPADRRRLPRPFESWFEVEVFLFLEDHGYEALPQEQTGRCRADLTVMTAEAELLAIECAGAGWRRGDRVGGGEPCGHERIGVACRTVRVLEREWMRRPAATQASLLESLGASGQVRSAG